MDKFPCDKCGICCRYIDRAIKSIGITDFPYSNKDGVCEMLVGNKCSVYDVRPIICNVDAWIDKFGINRDWFYKLNMEACTNLKRQELINEIDKDIA